MAILLLDGRANPAALIREIKVEHVPFLEVTEDRAATEGEGDLSLERWRRVRVMDAPESWTYRVAVNVWKRQQGRTALGRLLLRRTVPRSEHTTSAGLPVEVRELVDSLPRRQREVLVLRLVLGLSQAETAAVTGLAEGTVASTLSDAKRSLRSAMADERSDRAKDPEVTP